MYLPRLVLPLKQLLVLLRVKIEGPELDIPDPKAPADKAAFFISLKCGIKIERSGSEIITSTNNEK